jgi:hypothetical protein
LSQLFVEIQYEKQKRKAIGTANNIQENKEKIQKMIGDLFMLLFVFRGHSFSCLFVTCDRLTQKQEGDEEKERKSTS